MFAKNMAVGYLLDFYGGMLTERARSIMEQYYRDDLSLGEIAENLGISRQGVRHVIKHAEEQLLSCERTLGLSAQFRSVLDSAERIRDLASSLNELGEEGASLAARIDAEVERILGLLS
ncbi:MAG: HTH domain-containing protein [Clostridia bacterium]|nr:HTH domain-containing protein [Clostridia bacterium]